MDCNPAGQAWVRPDSIESEILAKDDKYKSFRPFLSVAFYLTANCRPPTLYGYHIFGYKEPVVNDFPSEEWQSSTLFNNTLSIFVSNSLAGVLIKGFYV